MIVAAYDSDTLTLVARTCKDKARQDTGEFIRFLGQLAVDAKKQPGTRANLLMVVRHVGIVDKSESRRLTEAELAIPELNFALATSSFVVRSFAIAMQVLLPSPHRRRSTHSDTLSALAWFDEVAPGCSSRIVQLLAELDAAEMRRAA